MNPMTDCISRNHIEAYARDGFVVVSELFSRDSVTGLRAALKPHLEALDARPEHSESNRDVPAIVQIHNIWQRSAMMRRYVFDLRCAEVARCLAGTDLVRLWHDQVLVKPAQGAKATPWHQDFAFWPMYETSGISAWIALDDVDSHNGCLTYVPRSHKWGLVPLIGDHSLEAWFERSGEVSPAKPVRVPLKAGSVVFHNALTLHGALPNCSPCPRRALKIIYLPNGVRYRARHHVATDAMDLKDGQPIRGDFFPVLARAPAAEPSCDGGSLIRT
jgi:ectoine hydroxylase-related dioxygenase (phytanoyl-CoA dioxygenase family)